MCIDMNQPSSMNESNPDSLPQGMETMHSIYNTEDADITFRSCDNVIFKVHSVILKFASDVFSGMVSMPSSANSVNDIILLSESSQILEVLFDSIYPRRRTLLRLEEFQFPFIFKLIDAAEKYDIFDIIGLTKQMVVRRALSGSALEHYAIASRHQWLDVIVHISRFIPPPQTENPAQRCTLEMIDTSNLLKLFSLHQRRRAALIRALSISYQKNLSDDIRDNHLKWEEISEDHSCGCRSQAHNKVTWAAFKMAVLSLFDLTSPYDCTQKFDRKSSFWADSKLKELWSDRCTKCSEEYFSKDSLCSEFSRVLGMLPSSVEPY